MATRSASQAYADAPAPPSTFNLHPVPQVFDKALEKFAGANGLFGSLLGPLSMLGGGGPGGEDGLFSKIEDLRRMVHRVKEQFSDPELTTFVCVCIPEFLSLYETERLIQDLAEYDIDSHNIVVNQVLSSEGCCHETCLLHARVKMQQKYISQYEDLYEDFHLVKTPLLAEEVRGIDKLR